MIVALVALGVVIGLTLGALGAGGSILAVPVLAHVAGLPASAATATSLVAVGSSALLAAFGHRQRVRLDVALWFVPTGFVGALVGAAVGRRLDGDVVLLAFSALMLVAAWRMMAAVRPSGAAGSTRNPPEGSSQATPARSRTREVVVVATVGAVVGFLTGLFGVGGGFVIVPALTLAVGLAMPAAIATSLMIVAANAAIALALRGTAAVDWPVALALTAPMLVGSIAGARVARRLDAVRARRGFAVLLVAVAVTNAIAVAV